MAQYLRLYSCLFQTTVDWGEANGSLASPVAADAANLNVDVPAGAGMLDADSPASLDAHQDADVSEPASPMPSLSPVPPASQEAATLSPVGKVLD